MKVKYTGTTEEQVRFFGHSDPRGILTVGCIYEVEEEVVHGWHTDLYLKGIKGKFNSVSFEEVSDV